MKKVGYGGRRNAKKKGRKGPTKEKCVVQKNLTFPLTWGKGHLDSQGLRSKVKEEITSSTNFCSTTFSEISEKQVIESQTVQARDTRKKRKEVGDS